MPILGNPKYEILKYYNVVLGTTYTESVFSSDEALPTSAVIIRSPTGRHVWTMRFCYYPRSVEVYSVYVFVCLYVCSVCVCVYAVLCVYVCVFVVLYVCVCTYMRDMCGCMSIAHNIWDTMYATHVHVYIYTL